MLRDALAGLLGSSLLGAAVSASPDGPVFPAAEWQPATPESRGVDAEMLDQIAELLASDGCIIKDGYLVKTWGDPARTRDWLSSAKPILSTLLFFAIDEGKVSSVDEEISRWGWALRGKDAGLRFRHLANMTSNYMQPEGPGEAYDYNDFAISLYVHTLQQVFGQTVSEAARQRLYGPLRMQDNPHHTERIGEPNPVGRAWLSPRDYARLCWFWMNRGTWDGRQLLPRRFFDAYLKPDVPPELPYSSLPRISSRAVDESPPEDYLGVRSFGGGTNQHRDYGSGIYGFNWWFNAPGHLGPEHPRAGQTFNLTWPGVPEDAFMTSGYGGNHSVMIPSLGIALISGGGKWERPTLDPGNPDYGNNRVIRMLADAAREVG